MPDTRKTHYLEEGALVTLCDRRIIAPAGKTPLTTGNPDLVTCASCKVKLPPSQEQVHPSFPAHQPRLAPEEFARLWRDIPGIELALQRSLTETQGEEHDYIQAVITALGPPPEHVHVLEWKQRPSEDACPVECVGVCACGEIDWTTLSGDVRIFASKQLLASVSEAPVSGDAKKKRWWKRY